jgi:hypothetical protein
MRRRWKFTSVPAAEPPQNGTRPGRGNVSKSRPRYGLISDEALKVAGFVKALETSAFTCI